MMNAMSRPRAAVAVLAISTALLGLGSAAAAAPAPGNADVYVVHGLPGVTADILVDGDVVEAGADAQTIVGPLEVAAGDHTVTLHPTAGLTADVSAQVSVTAGESVDVIAHSAADAAATPKVTVYPNDLAAVAPGKSRLVVAHTAAVPPADIRVNGDVLFSNVANGEALTLLVPAATYSVDIVPTGTTGPAVFGPVDLPITAGQLTRVFALGDPNEDSMAVVVHTLTVPIEGAAAPGMVQTGNGGQAAGLAQEAAQRGYGADTTSGVSGSVLAGVGALGLASLLLLGVSRRRRHA